MANDEITSNGNASLAPSTFPKERGGESACVARRGSRSVYFCRMVRFLHILENLLAEIFDLMDSIIWLFIMKRSILSFGDEFVDQEYKSFGQVVGMLILTNGES